ncbi:DUF1156 domain-containing protein [Candidatus Hakubella thermalkaliphila]|uniref:DNA methylase N-4/N-6 domain-containing protein n=1 Tax=Candidatus Hakubella thermalkaliphila TaxID=2754717 RepID=A0A6V8PBM7_9ACTN|nr:DNA methyltransferase [Candidatus Hakubella thermalkaliphila]GFP29698.1 hypothetical protein HKBW3S34_00618 [Candidatus Hakubella thermalkaliphila]GFP38648.1 hypothetical protein HKBW3S47_00349 [Candidatus Hakubella thermalkaliphila]
MAFIEKDLPIENLNPVAMGEGNAKKPIYQMHKWWARRLGSVFRMITLSAFSSDEESAQGVWKKFCGGANLSGKTVLDPFMGGGTTVVEALRLGCRVIGVDVNPVAWFVTKKQIEPVDIEALDTCFEHLEQTAGEFIKSYYKTQCPRGHEAEVMYFFWVKVAQCHSCGAVLRLFSNYELSRRSHVNVSICPRCLQIVETVGYNQKTKCPECHMIFDPRKGISGRGIFRCTECGAQGKILDAVARKGRALDVQLHGLEGYCTDCGRFFKRVDEDDLRLYEKARHEFIHRRQSLLIPHQAIPIEGRSDPRPVNHGYFYFWQLFNERQLLCLSTLQEEILKLPDPNIKELMLIAFSDCLDANNMFCKYEVEWHKISLFFGLHAYHPIERPTENNVWGTRYGRCTFVKCFEKVRRAKGFAQRPYEQLVDARGSRFSKRTGTERIEAYLTESFSQLKKHDNASLLKCQSSEDLSFLPNKSVDAVITDPPYFDNVQYSELADFFYVWLRLALKDEYLWFKPDLSSRPDEIVKNDRLGKTTDFFSQGLFRVFKECHRVLKDEGLLIFTFHHIRTWAWENIAQVLIDAGFYVSASPIVRSEGKSGFHSNDGNIRYDCVLVCRKRAGQWMERPWASAKEQILQDAVQWTRRTLESGMLVNEVDVFTIVMGKTLEYCTKVFPYMFFDNNTVSISNAMEEMKNFVDHVAENARGIQKPLPKAYAQSAEQLLLFLKESETRYRNQRSR